MPPAESIRFWGTLLLRFGAAPWRPILSSARGISVSDVPGRGVQHLVEVNRESWPLRRTGCFAVASMSYRRSLRPRDERSAILPTRRSLHAQSAATAIRRRGCPPASPGRRCAGLLQRRQLRSGSDMFFSRKCLTPGSYPRRCGWRVSSGFCARSPSAGSAVERRHRPHCLNAVSFGACVSRSRWSQRVPAPPIGADPVINRAHIRGRRESRSGMGVATGHPAGW